MPSAVVTGANSGIGHAFAHILIQEVSLLHPPARILPLTPYQGWDVHALDVLDAPALQQLPCKKYKVDVTDPRSVANFADLYGSEQPLHLLLNVAGVLPSASQDPIQTATKESFERVFAVNSIGPFLLTQALLPSLSLAGQQGGAKVGIVSSRVGSMTDNSSGGSYAYRSSKAAVNSVGRSLSVDLKAHAITVLLLHPGVVRSGMTSHFPADELQGSVEPDVAALGLWENVLKPKGLDSTGTFWHREGYELPW